MQEQEEPSLDLSDDEELAQAFDMHSLIVSSLHHEDEDHVESADDVIRQIENMMKVHFTLYISNLHFHIIWYSFFCKADL